MAVTDSSADVIVVGGGFAGAIAARDLRKQGHSVLLVEARDRLGGRTWYRPFADTSESVEFGGGWISARTMPNAAMEIERYGLRLAGRPEPRLDFGWRGPSGMRTGFPLAGQEIFEFERLGFQLLTDAHRVDPRFPCDEQDLADLDMSVDEYMARFSASPDVAAFVDTWARIGSGARGDEWSALQLLSWVAAFGHSMWGYLAEVSEHVVGGTSSLLDAIVQDHPAEILLSGVVAEVAQSDDGVSIALRDGRKFTSAVAVIAIPVNTWSDIEFNQGLGDGRASITRRGGHLGRMQKVWIQVENVSPATMVAGATSRFLLLSAEYLLDGSVLLVGFVAPPQELDFTSLDDLQGAVTELLPRATVIEADWHDWRSDPFSKGTWRVPRPGELSANHSALTQPHGRLIFAGSDVATLWSGWIDGAIETGRNAAKVAAKLLATGR